MDWLQFCFHRTPEMCWKIYVKKTHSLFRKRYSKRMLRAMYVHFNCIHWQTLGRLSQPSHCGHLCLSSDWVIFFSAPPFTSVITKHKIPRSENIFFFQLLKQSTEVWTWGKGYIWCWREMLFWKIIMSLHCSLSGALVKFWHWLIVWLWLI